jgi:hypothetical protein
MAEYNAVTEQVVNPGESIIFTTTAVPCVRGFVRHRDDTGSFLLSGFVPYNSCGCRGNSASYLVDFGANIAVPTDGTIEEISVAIAIDGATIPASTMRVTPAAVEEYANVSRAINAEIWRGCCETVSVRNTSAQPILVSEANIIFSRPDLYITR